MTKYLISFPASAMVIAEADMPDVVADSHAVIREAKEAGVYVFGGGLDATVPVVQVTADGTVSSQAYPEVVPHGGYTVLELPTPDDALRWAAKLARACRCAQDVRAFGFDPES